MTSRDPLRATVFVVGSNLADYLTLQELAADGQWEIRFFAGGRDVLRLGEHSPPDLWIVNVRLPDISGLDLVEMLQPRRAGSVLLMMADQYHAEDEIRALSLGVDQYSCKPLEAAYLRQWHPSQRLTQRPNRSGSDYGEA